MYVWVSLAEDHDVTVPRGTSVNRKLLLPISWKIRPMTIATERPIWSTAMRQSLIRVNFDVVYARPRAVCTAVFMALFASIARGVCGAE